VNPLIRRLNHAVLYVRDARRAAAFYTDVLGLEVVIEAAGGTAVFLRAPGGDNHHDLGLFSVGAQEPPRGGVGLYHLAWEVGTVSELVAVRDRLAAAGALVGASDHGISKSLYGRDADGIEFEVMWALPREHWGTMEHEAIVRPLDLDAELARWG